MKKKINHPRYELKIGDIRYVAGYKSTTVEVIGYPDDFKVRVKYLTVGSSSSHKVGETCRMSRRNLYPYGGR